MFKKDNLVKVVSMGIVGIVFLSVFLFTINQLKIVTMKLFL